MRGGADGRSVGPQGRRHAWRGRPVDRQCRLVRRYQGPQGSSLRSRERAHKSWDMPDQVGWVLPSDGGEMVVGLKDGALSVRTRDRCCQPHPQARARSPMEPAQRRVHRQQGPARFGSMDDGESKPTGHLFRCAGVFAPTPASRPCRSPTAPRSMPTRRSSIHTDTIGRIIYKIPVHDDGSLGKPGAVRVDRGGWRLSGRARGRCRGMPVDRPL